MKKHHSKRSQSQVASQDQPMPQVPLAQQPQPNHQEQEELKQKPLKNQNKQEKKKESVKRNKSNQKSKDVKGQKAKEVEYPAHSFIAVVEQAPRKRAKLNIYEVVEEIKQGDQEIRANLLISKKNKNKDISTFILNDHQQQEQHLIPVNTPKQKIELDLKIKKVSKKKQNEQPQYPRILTTSSENLKSIQERLIKQQKQAKEKKHKKQVVDAVAPQRAKSAPRPPNKRQKLADEEREKYALEQVIDGQEENAEMINEEEKGNQEGRRAPPKKRERKAAAKVQPKPKKEEILPREDVLIPEINEDLESSSQEPQTGCCQTCSNRNCIRAVKINSPDLMIHCLKSLANISSLIEHLSPDQMYSALELAISLNRLETLELLLTQDKPENEYRMKKRDCQIAKFETGEVSDMAFGVKVRKVQMMRGNRQGNNAFTEDSTHNHLTPIDYLINNDHCLSRCFPSDCVTLETLQLLNRILGDERFEIFINTKALPLLLRRGCFKIIQALFRIFGHENDIQNSFFNRVFYLLLTAQNIEEIDITPEDLALAKRNDKCNYAHVAAFNPSGAGLRFLIENNHEFDVTVKQISTAHYAAVCPSVENLKILIEKEIDVHDEDEQKKTPLMWAIEAKKSIEHFQTIMNEITKPQKDFKDHLKLMAVHYFCKYGIDSTLESEIQSQHTFNIMTLLMDHKAKFSQVAGYMKYTPLIYACINGHYEIVKFMLENVPRLNINKGDKYKRTPLIMCARNGHSRILALLIKHNADVDLPDSSNNTALHYAAAYGWIECVRVLIQYGADPSPENAWKSTPLTIALQKNHIRIVKELLKSQDISVNTKDDEGRSILALAMANINHESIEFVDLLINQKKAEVNSQDAKGRTPLYHLVESMNNRKRGLFTDFDELEFKIVKILLGSGANVNVKTKEGKSPFTLAFEYGMTDLLQIFGSNVDLNQDPTLFFAFNGPSIMKTQVHLQLREFMDNKRLEDETINFVNDEGFTPLLFYIHKFLEQKHNCLQQIQDMINRKAKITNENIIDLVQNNFKNDRPGLVQQVVTDQALKFYEKEIVEPFIELLQFLLDSGANINAYVLKLKQYREESTGLSQLSQNTQMAQQLGRRPPEKNQYISEGLGLCNCVHLILDTPIRKLFDFVINIKGINLNQVSLQNMSPFFKLVKTKDINGSPDYKYCFEQLLKTGKISIDTPDQFGMSAFWYFYTNNRMQEALYLVDKGANINHIDNYGMFALKRELFQANYENLKVLLEKGANPNQKDEFQRTVMHLACDFAHRKHYSEIFKLLLKHKADIFELDFKKRTPIHYLFVKKNKRQQIDEYDPIMSGLEVLVNKQTKDSFNINHQDINGKTILHYAAQRGSLQSLNYLLDLYGIESFKFDLEDIYLNTPLSVAINCKHFGLAQRLIQLGVYKLKSFIYQEKHAPRQQQNHQMMFGGAFGQDDEQSDMEYMQITQFDSILEEVEKKKHDNLALNLFRYIIRNNLVEMEQLFIKCDYDRIQMVVDYICEGQINKLFQIINTHFKDQSGAKNSILIQKNIKGQNLIHVLAKNAHLIKDVNEIIKFYKQLIEEGVNPKETDQSGKTALHFAIKSGNIHFIKFLVDVEQFDVNQTDHKGLNSISQLIKGDRILQAQVPILQYLIQKGANPNLLYTEKMYQAQGFNNKEEVKNEKDSGYKSTCIIHAIRHESKVRDNIRLILKELLLHADPSLQDSYGRDAFFYIAMRNHLNTFYFILDTIEDQKKSFDSIVKNVVDVNGKSFIHMIVSPLEYGSYENAEMLRKALEVGYEFNIKDKTGQTPYQYSCMQKSGVLKKVFEEFQNQNENMIHQQPIAIDDLLNQGNLIQQDQSINFEKDAQDYLQSIQMQIDPHKFVPCDPSGKFNEDCVVMYDENLEQHFDVYLTRVEIGKFQPGGDYLFYKMQLVMDKSRDLPILLTRWGRIGEEGAFQKTPFKNEEEAIAEFKKIFEQKTNNRWCHKDKFQKSFRKFQLMRTNYITIDQKNYLLPFNIENAPAVNEQILSKEGIEIMKEICDVDTYLRALKNSGVDPKAMPFSNIDRKNLYDALEVLLKLQKVLVKLEGMNPRPYAEAQKMKLLTTREKMWYLSSRFYEFIPHTEYRNKMVPPIGDMEILIQKSAMLQNLIQIEMASKILLGALYQAENIHPLEYCTRAAGIQFEILKKDKDRSEYKLLEEYVLNTYTDQNKKHIKNIIRLTKLNEAQTFQSEMENRVLLFHGSKISNFLGILSQGLRVQPLEVQRNGDLLGKGIYFSDMMSKSIQYTNDANGSSYGSRYVLVCEVALGNCKELTNHHNNYKLEEGYQSVMGLGRQGPDSNVTVTLPDGAKIPLGKVINQKGAQNSAFQYNEYVVPDSSQVRMRYLIQLK